MSNSVSEEKFNGSCQCGSIKVVLTGRPIKAMSCHCVDCQKSASGPYQTCALYPTSAVELIDPESNIKKYIVPKEEVGSGVEKEKWFCGVCGTPIYNRPMKHNGEKTVIKTGILESLDLLIPTSELYTKDRVSFVNPIEGAKQFETAA